MKETLSLPKDTFSKLPPDKRSKIEAAFVKEFATNGYRKASLNTVVNALGIAKGSLYQYFRNKEAIFLYIFDQFTRKVKTMVQQTAEEAPPAIDLWTAVKRTMLAGVTFIDRFPDYYQLYLTVLFEQDVPHREALIARVRLFSMEFFGPLIVQGRKAQTVNPTAPVEMVVFLIDAVLDRFLQGYARSYMDGGLGLSVKDGTSLIAEIDLLIETLKQGLAGPVRT